MMHATSFGFGHICRLGFLVFLAAGANGCSSDSANTPPADAQISPDSAGIDSSAGNDSATLAADVSPDTAMPVDTREDAAAANDNGADQQAPAQDSANTADAATPSTNPCAPSATKVGQQGAIVACQAAGTVDQCQAEKLCNQAGGWSMCGASRYQKTFGTAAPPFGMKGFWIKGCIRSGAAMHAPLDKLCDATCPGTILKGDFVAWFCSNGSFQGMSAYGHIGLLAGQVCLQVGTQSSANQAYWEPKQVTFPAPGALCCK